MQRSDLDSANDGDPSPSEVIQFWQDLNVESWPRLRRGSLWPAATGRYSAALIRWPSPIIIGVK